MFVFIVQCFDYGSVVRNFEWPRAEGRVDTSLICDIKHLGMAICCIQETHVIANEYEGILMRSFHISTEYFGNHTRGVS